MPEYARAPHFTFPTKAKAENFIKDIKKVIYNCDVIIVNDILKLADESISRGLSGFHYGYAKKDIKGVKPEKINGYWVVQLPIPGRMIRDVNTHHWTTESTGGDG